MEIYKINTIEELIKGNSYVGRGIITGLSEDGKTWGSIPPGFPAISPRRTCLCQRLKTGSSRS